MIATNDNKPKRKAGDYQVPVRPATRRLFDLIARETDWPLSTVSDKAIKALAEKLSVQLPNDVQDSPTN